MDDANDPQSILYAVLLWCLLGTALFFVEDSQNTMNSGDKLPTKQPMRPKTKLESPPADAKSPAPAKRPRRNVDLTESKKPPLLHSDNDSDDDDVVFLGSVTPRKNDSSQKGATKSSPKVAFQDEAVLLGSARSNSAQKRARHSATKPSSSPKVAFQDGDSDKKMPARIVVDLTLSDDEAKQTDEDQEKKDRELALKLAEEQEQEALKREQARLGELESMIQTNIGKAVTFVQVLLEAHTQLEPISSTYPNFIDLVARDDIVALAERTFNKQDEFRAAGIPYHIDLGFHYTQPHNLKSIQTGGLLTKKDRESNKIKAHFNGSAYGDGVYTTNGLFDTWNQRYGNTGLLVARLQGRTGRVIGQSNMDTLLTGTWAVLQSSEQCIALFQFDGTQMNRSSSSCPSVAVLKPLTEKVQQSINALLNKGTINPNPPSIDSSWWSRRTAVARAPAAAVNPPPVTTNASTAAATAHRVSGHVPRTFHSTQPSGAVPASAPAVASVNASQTIFGSWKFTPNPGQQGKMPAGDLTVYRVDQHCGGNENVGSLQLVYKFPDGIQGPTDPQPNQPYKGGQLVAYIPCSWDGFSLCRRLALAFQLGLTFELTASNGATCKLSSFLIPHKTFLSGAPDGFPDPSYINKCNSVLDSLRVPRG